MQTPSSECPVTPQLTPPSYTAHCIASTTRVATRSSWSKCRTDRSGSVSGTGWLVRRARRASASRRSFSPKAPVAPSAAAIRPAATRACTLTQRRRLPRADEGAHELAVDLVGERGWVETAAGEKCGGVFRFVDARRLDLHAAKSRVGEQVAILELLERAGDAADPELHVASKLLGCV